MSIINDALKKAQSDLTQNNQKEEKPKKTTKNIYEKLHKPKPSSQTPQEKTPPKKNKNFLIPIFLVIIILAFLGGLTAYLLKDKQLISNINFSLPKLPSPIGKTSSTRRSYNDGDLVLSGTMMMEDKRVALINDEVYEVGDTINGNRIMSISLKKVEIMNPKGKTVTLRVGRN